MTADALTTPDWTVPDPDLTRAAARVLIRQSGYEVTPDLLGALEAIGALGYERLDGSREGRNGRTRREREAGR